MTKMIPKRTSAGVIRDNLEVMSRSQSAEITPVTKERSKFASKGTTITDVLSAYERFPSATITEIAHLLGVHRSAVSRMLTRHNVTPDRITKFRAQRASLLSLKQADLLESITKADIAKTGLKDRAGVFKIFHESERLELNKSTANVNVRTIDASLAELEIEEKKLEAQLGVTPPAQEVSL